MILRLTTKKEIKGSFSVVIYLNRSKKRNGGFHLRCMIYIFHLFLLIISMKDNSKNQKTTIANSLTTLELCALPHILSCNLDQLDSYLFSN